jgi:hypothetical protein
VVVLIALVVVASVAMLSVLGACLYGLYAARKAADETRAQMHSALVDERSLWLDQQRAWSEERMMLLDRISSRDGSVLDVLRGPTAEPEKPVPTEPVEWDPDLEPFEFETAEGGGDGA